MKSRGNAMNNFGCLLLSHRLSTTLFEFLICTTTNLVPEVFFCEHVESVKIVELT
jgi:hypothetical protein